LPPIGGTPEYSIGPGRVAEQDLRNIALTPPRAYLSRKVSPDRR
jgi:hypothetical protein